MCLKVLKKILGKSEVQQHIIILAMIFLDAPCFDSRGRFTSVWVAVQKEKNLTGAPVVTLVVFRIIRNSKQELPLSFLCPGFVPDSNLKGKDPAPRCL